MDRTQRAVTFFLAVAVALAVAATGLFLRPGDLPARLQRPSADALAVVSEALRTDPVEDAEAVGAQAARPAVVALASDNAVVAADAPPVAVPATTPAATLASAYTPRFGLVTVQPSGEATLVGDAEPGARVEVFDNGAVAARATANGEGAWGLELDAPLAAGAHDLALRVTAEDGRVQLIADQRVSVLVPPPGSSGVLVAVTEPGRPTQVLQLPAPAPAPAVPADPAPAVADEAAPISPSPQPEPAAPEARTAPPPAAPAEPSPAPVSEPDVAGAEPQPEPAPIEAPAAPIEGAAVPPQPAPGPAQSEGPAESPPDEAPAPPEGGPDGRVAAVPAQPGLDAQGLPQDPAEGGRSPAPPPVVALHDGPASVDVPAEAAPAEVAPAEAAPAELQPRVAMLPPSPPAPTLAPMGRDPEDAMRPPEEAEPSPGPAAAAGAVAAQPEPVQVAEPRPPVVMDLPPVAPPVPSATPAPAPAPPPAPEAASRPEEPAQVSPPRATIATVEVETAGTVLASGSAAAGSAVRLYVDDVFLAEVAADEDGSWAFVGELALAAGDHRLRADALIGSGGRVASRAEVTFEVVETLAQLEPAPLSPLPPAEPPAEPADAAAAPLPEASAPAPDTVTIRRGDDLWHIARRVYGAGIRYITIYDANRDQIRDPNLIYPGQVLVLPPP